MGPLIGAIDQSASQVLVRGGLAWESGFAFFARNQDRTVDLASLCHNAERLESFISQRQAALGLEKKTFLMGFSNGAIMAAALLIRRRLRLDGAILFRPLAPDLEVKESTFPKPPVLILEGMKDQRREPTDAAKLTSKFRQAGYRVSQWATDCDHGPVDAENHVARHWLDEVAVK